VSRAVSEIRAARNLAYAASAGIIMVCALAIWYTVLPAVAWPLYTSGLMNRTLAFELIYQNQPAELTTLVSLAAAVAFLIWLSRARRNVSALPQASRLIRGGWLVPMWIIPLVSLFLPGLFVARVAEISTGAPVERPSRAGLQRLVWTWWACWALSESFATATSGWLRLSINTTSIPWFAYAADGALYFASGVLAIVMMFKIVSAQAALFTGLMPVPDPSDFPTFTVDDVQPR
jgi:hypothetical protein